MFDRTTRRRSRAWAGLLSLGALVVPLGVTSTAHADYLSPGCPAGVQWVDGGPINFDGTGPDIWWGDQYTANSITPTFSVDQQEVVQNGTNTTIMGSFSSTIAKTFTLSATVQVGGSLFGFLTTNVSSSITMSTTATVGVSATAPVPPNSEVIGQYGDAGYNVNFTDTYWESIGDPTSDDPYYGQGLCGVFSSSTGSVSAPTTNVGWRVIPG